MLSSKDKKPLWHFIEAKKHNNVHKYQLIKDIRWSDRNRPR